MNSLEINIFGKPYRVSCDEGEERHLKELAVYLDRKVRSMAPPQGGSDTHILVITALTLADELNEVSREAQEFKDELLALKHKIQNYGENSLSPADLLNIANHIEILTAELDKLSG